MKINKIKRVLKNPKNLSKLSKNDSKNKFFDTPRFVVCVNSPLQFVRKQTQILGVLKNPRHAPDFSPRVLDTFNFGKLKFLKEGKNNGY